jgi:prefoldin alpha subunit
MEGKDDERQRLQEKLLIYQFLEKQLEALGEQATLLDERSLEVESTRQAIHAIKELGEDNDTLISLGSGLFARSGIKGKRLLAGVGSDVLLEKSVQEAEEFLEARFRELDRAGSEIERQTRDAIEKMNVIAPEIQELNRKVQG